MTEEGEQPGQLVATLAREPVSAGRARHFVAEALHQLGRETHVDVATLLTSELVTNAVLHGRGELCLRVSTEAAAVRIELDDASTTLPLRRWFDEDAGTGRGMVLVEELAAAWGSSPRPDGKTVWFELA